MAQIIGAKVFVVCFAVAAFAVPFVFAAGELLDYVARVFSQLN